MLLRADFSVLARHRVTAASEKSVGEETLVETQLEPVVDIHFTNLKTSSFVRSFLEKIFS